MGIPFGLIIYFPLIGATNESQYPRRWAFHSDEKMDQYDIDAITSLNTLADGHSIRTPSPSNLPRQSAPVSIPSQMGIPFGQGSQFYRSGGIRVSQYPRRWAFHSDSGVQDLANAARTLSQYPRRWAFHSDCSLIRTSNALLNTRFPGQKLSIFETLRTPPKIKLKTSGFALLDRCSGSSQHRKGSPHLSRAPKTSICGGGSTFELRASVVEAEPSTSIAYMRIPRQRPSISSRRRAAWTIRVELRHPARNCVDIISGVRIPSSRPIAHRTFGLNTLAGGRSFQTSRRWCGVSLPGLCLNTLAGGRSFQTESLVYTLVCVMLGLNTLAGGRSFQTLCCL